MIDWDRITTLRDEVGAEDFGEVVEIFLEEVDEELGGLPAIACPSALAEKLHFLKGSALNLGFVAFSDACSQGESQLHRDPETRIDRAAITELYQASRREFIAGLPERLADYSSL